MVLSSSTTRVTRQHKGISLFEKYFCLCLCRSCLRCWFWWCGLRMATKLWCPSALKRQQHHCMCACRCLWMAPTFILDSPLAYCIYVHDCQNGVDEEFEKQKTPLLNHRGLDQKLFLYLRVKVSKNYPFWIQALSHWQKRHWEKKKPPLQDPLVKR